jgi:hypothetical protein
MDLRVPYNAGKLSSGCTTGGLSSSAQLHRVSSAYQNCMPCCEYQRMGRNRGAHHCRNVVFLRAIGIFWTLARLCPKRDPPFAVPGRLTRAVAQADTEGTWRLDSRRERPKWSERNLQLPVDTQGSSDISKRQEMSCCFHCDDAGLLSLGGSRQSHNEIRNVISIECDICGVLMKINSCWLRDYCVALLPEIWNQRDVFIAPVQSRAVPRVQLVLGTCTCN